ncbi:carbohydrate ABC transporter permease [Streptomyces sp. NBC_00554]|uniref:carbohydrate ABC transporter permease n=1 Tax=unclassified Streptomyces TaxID=2593676 RepID=UPI002257F6CB|nr:MULTISPECIES: carbohydrate ABC transporter permease [unclassified Streptomyces]MCX4978127.1 carbohydrate ABC transporter permease [Streptomyces sp. NBC_00620]WUC47966.1 carbohydrate ABC transporter permease [Streptomyces sp. NBC_00554]
MTVTMDRKTGPAAGSRPPRASRRTEPGRVRQTTRTKTLVISGLVLFSLYSLLPVWWLIVSATKSRGDLYTTNGLWFTDMNVGENLRQLFTYQDGIFLRWMWNTLFYGFVGTAGMTLICVACGYGLAMYEFRGKGFLMGCIIGSFLVPGALLTIPSFLLYTDLNLIDTPSAIIVPSFFNAFSVYLAKVYAEGAIPPELLEAARIDGAGEYRIFFRIGARLMSTGAATIFLLGFVGSWNSFFGPLVFLRSSEKWTVMLGLYSWLKVKTDSSYDLTGMVVVGSIVSLIPMVILLISMQRYWRSGVTLGSLK